MKHATRRAQTICMLYRVLSRTHRYPGLALARHRDFSAGRKEQTWESSSVSERQTGGSVQGRKGAGSLGRPKRRNAVPVADIAPDTFVGTRNRSKLQAKKKRGPPVMRKGKPVEPPPPQAYVYDLLRDCKQPSDVLDVFDQEQGAFDLVNCAIALRRFRQLQVSKAPHKRGSIDKRRLAGLAAHSMTELEQQKLAPPPRTIATLAHSLTVLGFADTKFSLRVASVAAGQLNRFSSIDLAQLLGALSKGGRVERQRGTGVVARSPLYHGGLLQEASPRIARLANRMNGQTLVQLWLPLAAVGHHDDVAVPALERELLRKRADLTHQGLCNAVQGAAKLGRNRSPLFSELAPALTKAAPKLAPVGLAQVLWAYTSTGNFDLPLIGALAKAARHPQRARAMSPQQLANVSTSLARTVLFAESVPYYAAYSAAVQLAGLKEEGGYSTVEATGANGDGAGNSSVTSYSSHGSATYSSHGSAPVIAEDRSKVTRGADLALELEVGGAPRKEQLLRAKDLAGMSRSQLKMESRKRRQALIKSIRLEDAMKQFAGRAKALLGAWGEYESKLHAAKSSVRQETELAQQPGNKGGSDRPTGHAPDTVGGALAEDGESMAPSQPGNKHDRGNEHEGGTMDAWGVVDTNDEDDDDATAGVARAISQSVRPASTGTAALAMEVERAREAVEAKGGVFHGVTGDMKDTGRGRGRYQQRAPQEMLPIDVTALASTFRKLGVKDDEFSGMVAEHMARHCMKYRAADLIKTAESLGSFTPARHAAIAAAALASPKVVSRLQKQTNAKQLAAAVTVASGCLPPALLPALYARDSSSRTGKGKPLGFVQAMDDPVAMAAAPKLRRFLRAAGDTLAKRSTELLPGSIAMAAAELALAGIDPGALLLRLARDCSHKDMRSWGAAQHSALLAMGLHCIAVHESGGPDSADDEEVAHAARKIAGYALHQMQAGWSMSPVDAALCSLGAALATNPNGGAKGGWIYPETVLKLVEAAEKRLMRETMADRRMQRVDGADSSVIVKAVRKSGALPALGLARAMAAAAAGADRSREAGSDDASGGEHGSESDSRILATIREAAARAAEASLTGWGVLSFAPRPSPSMTPPPSTPALEFLSAALAKTMPGSDWDQGVLRALQEASGDDSELADLLRGTEVATGEGYPAAGGAAGDRVTVASVTRALRQLRERAYHGVQHRCGIRAGVVEALGMLNGYEAASGSVGAGACGAGASARALEVWPPARLPSSRDVVVPPEWVPGVPPAEEVATGDSSQSGGGGRAGESAGSAGGLRLWALADAWVRVGAGAGDGDGDGYETSRVVPVVVATGAAPSGGGESGRLSPLDGWRVGVLSRGLSPGGSGGGVAVVREGEWREAARGGWTKEQQDILRSAPSAGTLRRVLQVARGEHAAAPGEQQLSLVRHALHSAGIRL